jgi:hypothetical protein
MATLTAQVRKIIRESGAKTPYGLWTNRYKTYRTVKCYVSGTDFDEYVAGSYPLSHLDEDVYNGKVRTLCRNVYEWAARNRVECDIKMIDNRGKFWMGGVSFIVTLPKED